jgi:DEAD/DEAH box helicase domain-containing protein
MANVPLFDPERFPGDVTLDHIIPARPARYLPLPAGLRPELAAALATRGIERLYSHQAEAYEHVRSGRHLVVVTPTASGKTLCYNLPVLQRLLEQPTSRALCRSRCRST